MKKLLVQPKMAYKLLGTELTLDPSKTYEAIVATNLPDWHARKAGYCDEVILEANEYEIMRRKFRKDPQANEDCTHPSTMDSRRRTRLPHLRRKLLLNLRG